MHHLRGKNDPKDSFYEEMEQVFVYFPRTMLVDFKAKLGKGDIFKPTIWNENLHQDSNDNGARIVNFATSKS
jgi:hypothetical protein